LTAIIDGNTLGFTRARAGETHVVWNKNSKARICALLIFKTNQNSKTQIKDKNTPQT